MLLVQVEHLLDGMRAADAFAHGHLGVALRLGAPRLRLFLLLRQEVVQLLLLGVLQGFPFQVQLWSRRREKREKREKRGGGGGGRMSEEGSL